MRQAVQLLRRGDDAALEQALALLQKYAVFSFSMRVCGQREDAEDTMQEVLLKSVPQLPKFDSPKALVVWLYKVAENRCLISQGAGASLLPKKIFPLEELMPDRKELEQLSSDACRDRFRPCHRARCATCRKPPAAWARARAPRCESAG